MAVGFLTRTLCGSCIHGLVGKKAALGPKDSQPWQTCIQVAARMLGSLSKALVEKFTWLQTFGLDWHRKESVYGSCYEKLVVVKKCGEFLWTSRV